jgi:hypothetical protein
VRALPQTASSQTHRQLWPDDVVQELPLQEVQHLPALRQRRAGAVLRMMPAIVLAHCTACRAALQLAHRLEQPGEERAVLAGSARHGAAQLLAAQQQRGGLQLQLLDRAHLHTAAGMRAWL